MSNIPDDEEDEECAEVEGKAKCEVAEVLFVDMEITKVEAISFAGNNLTRKNLLDPGENTFVVKGLCEAQGRPPADTCAGVDQVYQPMDTWTSELGQDPSYEEDDAQASRL